MTRALLKRDFGLEWDLPPDNLVPPVGFCSCVPHSFPLTDPPMPFDSCYSSDVLIYLPVQVPSRLNYILWIEDLLRARLSFYPGWLDSARPEPQGSRVNGIDVGTGASCIYALLGTLGL